MSTRVPTIRDIALASGCHNSTVSRALNNHPKIPAAKREEILALAQSMGWKPNPLASAYVAHRRATREPCYQSNLAYIISHDVPHFQDLPTFFQLNMEGARAQAAKQGFILEPYWLREVGFDVARMSRMLKSRGIPGVVIHTAQLPVGFFNEFDWSAFSSATWGYSVVSPVLHRAAFDWVQGARLVVEQLRQRGYRHMALAIPEYFDQLTNHTLSSTFYHFQNHPSPGEKFSVRVVSDNQTMEDIKAWLPGCNPEVIMGTHEVWNSLKELGWKIPEDIAFVSPHWSEEWPDVGGIDQLPRLVGANAVDLVTAQILRNERGLPRTPKLVLSTGCWIDGSSVPRVNLRTKRRANYPRTQPHMEALNIPGNEEPLSAKTSTR